MKTIAKTYNGKILAVLTEVKQTLPNALRRLSEYILNNTDAVVKHNLSDLADAAHVGEATVVRLVKQLGFESFQDFKIELTLELTKQHERSEAEDSLVELDIEEQDDPKLLSKKIKAYVCSALDENIEFVNERVLHSVVSAMLQADRTLCFGMGNSGLSAEYLKNKCARIGLNAAYDASTHYMYTAAALLKPGDVAIAISQQGQGYEVNKIMKIAKQAGATCVCITHHPSSPLAKMSDYVLFNGNKETVLQGDSMSTIAAQLHICELIYVMLLQANYQKALKTKQRTVNALDMKL